MSVDIGEFSPARCLDHGSDACDCSRLRAERDEARAHAARIMALPPRDVASADAVIAQLASVLARDGARERSNALASALDTVKLHRGAMRAEIERLRGLLGRVEAVYGRDVQSLDIAVCALDSDQAGIVGSRFLVVQRGLREVLRDAFPDTWGET